MKTSRYNILVKNKTKNTICYNTRLDSFCLLSNNDAELLKNDLERLAQNSPKTVEALHNAGFIVDDDCDELSLLSKEYQSAANDTSTYYLTLLPSLDCNLRCWYCFEKHIHGSHLTPQVSFFFVTNAMCINDGNLEGYCQKRNMEMGIAEYVRYRFNNSYINPANYKERI